VSAASRRRVVVFAIPMIIALAAGRQVVPHVRAVDFLLIFAAGALFGVTLVGVIQALRAR